MSAVREWYVADKFLSLRGSVTMCMQMDVLKLQTSGPCQKIPGKVCKYLQVYITKHVRGIDGMHRAGNLQTSLPPSALGFM